MRPDICTRLFHKIALIEALTKPDGPYAPLNPHKADSSECRKSLLSRAAGHDFLKREFYRGSKPKTATPFGVPTNTLPLAIIGVMNLFALI